MIICPICKEMMKKGIIVEWRVEEGCIRLTIKCRKCKNYFKALSTLSKDIWIDKLE